LKISLDEVYVNINDYYWHKYKLPPVILDTKIETRFEKLDDITISEFACFMTNGTYNVKTLS